MRIQRKERLFAGVLSLIMLFGTLSVFAAEEDTAGETENTVAAGTEETIDPYAYEISFLKDIGVAEAGFSSTGNMTNGSFDTLMSAATAGVYAQPLADLNIIPPRFGVAYDPAGELTWEAAIKTAVTIIGRTQEAKNAGGNAASYRLTASRYGLLKGLPVNGLTAVSNGDAARLVYNMLHCDIVRQVEFGTSNRYNVVKNWDVLAEYHDIFCTSGVVQANEYASLTGGAKISVGRVVIDSALYYTGATGIENKLGYHLDVYYRQTEEDGDCTVVHWSETKKNKVLVLPAEDITDYKAMEYTYETDRGKKTVKISSSTALVYNGLNITGETIDYVVYQPEEGSVTLIDNNSDGRYDVAFIRNYIDYIAGGTNLSTKCIYTKFDGGTLELEAKNQENPARVIDENGAEVTLDTIKEWDVLSVSRAADGMINQILVSRNVMDGVAELVKEREKEIQVDGQMLKFSKVSKGLNFENLTAGDGYKFYLNAAGKIAYFSPSGAQSARLGYLIGASNTDAVFEEELKVKLYDVDAAAVIIIPGADKITLDGVRMESKKFYESLSVNGKIKRTLVRFRTNGNGELTWLDTPIDNENSLKANEGDSGLQKLFKSPIKNEETGAMRGYYYQSAGSFFHRPVLNPNNVDTNGDAQISDWVDGFTVNSGTKFLYIPGNRNEADGYSVKALNSYSEKSDIVVEAYRIGNNDDIPSIVLEYAGDGREEEGEGDPNDTGGITPETPIALVGEIFTTLNSDGEEINGMIVYSKNGKQEISVKDNRLLGIVGVEEGNIIRYATNSKGQIKGIEMVLNSRQIRGEETFTKTGNSLAAYRVMFGSAYKTYSAAVGMTLEDLSAASEANLVNLYPSSFLMVYIYHADTKTVENGKLGDIYGYVNTGIAEQTSRLFVHTKTGTPQVMVIYNDFE